MDGSRRGVIDFGRLHIEARLRARFLAEPRDEAERQGLTIEECAAAAPADRVGLELSTRSFAHKRALNASGRCARSCGTTCLDSD